MSDIEQAAQQRVAADEAALRRTKEQVTLGGTFRAFWRYPSPWMIAGALILTLTARIVVGDWRLGDLWGPVVLLALFPVLAWVVPVFVLHWRPRDVAGADSITFRLMFNSMRAAYEPVLDALAVVMSAEVDRVEAYDALTDAIEAGNGAAAWERAHDLLAVATTSLTDAIDALEQ